MIRAFNNSHLIRNIVKNPPQSPFIKGEAVILPLYKRYVGLLTFSEEV